MAKPGEKFRIVIDSILGGISPLQNFSKRDQYMAGIGIDPDFPVTDSGVRASGYLRPTAMAEFSGANISSAPRWIITQPKSETIYTVQANGRLVSYDSAFGTETVIADTFTVTIASPAVFSLTAHGLAVGDTVVFTTSGALPTGLTAGTTYYVISAGLTANAFEVSTSAGGSAVDTTGSQSGTHKVVRGAGNGAAYYDNYVYMAGERNVSRYGPLNGSPANANGYWVTTLSKTALTNTTYPSLRGLPIPNHPMHRHTDGKLYFGDVVGNAGVLHYINTSKTTVEGDTNNGSTYNALDFPYGYWPTAIETYGTNLAVALIEGSGTTTKQKPAKISFWDTTSSSYQQITDVEFPDPLITAIRNVNGILYVFSGNASGGCRVSRFIGGYSFQEVCYLEDSLPPFQGAVDHFMNKLYWGGFLTYPEAAGVVFSIGSKFSALGSPLHVPFKATSATATNQNVTALKMVEHANFAKPRPIIGWNNNDANGLDSLSTTYGVSVFRSQVFRMGQPFRIDRVRIPSATTIAANMTIIPKIFVDEEYASYTLRTLNNTNFSGKVYYADDAKAAGDHSFFMEIRWSGTVLCTLATPIIIEGIYV